MRLCLRYDLRCLIVARLVDLDERLCLFVYLMRRWLRRSLRRARVEEPPLLLRESQICLNCLSGRYIVSLPRFTCCGDIECDSSAAGADSTRIGSTRVGSTRVGSTRVGSTRVGSTRVGSTSVRFSDDDSDDTL